MDEDYPEHHPAGSRVAVLFVGLILGALGATIAWVATSGNPFSEANEIVYETITVADVTPTSDQICWSQNPERRDAERLCAILALDPAVEPPAPGDVVTIGRVQLRTPEGDDFRQVVYVRLSDAPADDTTEQLTDPPG
jgi:hypothetical protein